MTNLNIRNEYRQKVSHFCELIKSNELIKSELEYEL